MLLLLSFLFFQDPFLVTQYSNDYTVCGRCCTRLVQMSNHLISRICYIYALYQLPYNGKLIYAIAPVYETYCTGIGSVATFGFYPSEFVTSRNPIISHICVPCDSSLSRPNDWSGCDIAVLLPFPLSVGIAESSFPLESSAYWLSYYEMVLSLSV